MKSLCKGILDVRVTAFAKLHISAETVKKERWLDFDTECRSAVQKNDVATTVWSDIPSAAADTMNNRVLDSRFVG
jgi:hypothetical protein